MKDRYKCVIVNALSVCILYIQCVESALPYVAEVLWILGKVDILTRRHQRK